MTRVFLETTALIEVSFWDGPTKKKIRELTKGFQSEVTSRYVIYEACRGFLRYLIVLHNKARQLRSWSDLVFYAHRVHRKAYLAGAVITALGHYFASSVSFNHTSEMQRMASVRGYLRRLIRRGFRNMSNVQEVINDVRCREPDAPIEKNGTFDQQLNKKACGQRGDCGVKSYFETHRGSFESLRDMLRGQTKQDMETKRRIRSLRELYRVPDRDFAQDDCYSSGDAIIAHECPANAALLSKNKSHLELICKHFNKQAVFYT